MLSVLALHAAVAQTWSDRSDSSFTQTKCSSVCLQAVELVCLCWMCLSPCVGVKTSWADMESCLCHNSEKRSFPFRFVWISSCFLFFSSVFCDAGVSESCSASRRANTYLRRILTFYFVLMNLISCGRFLKIHPSPVFLAPWFSVRCITGEATCSVFIIRRGRERVTERFFSLPLSSANDRHTHPHPVCSRRRDKDKKKHPSTRHRADHRKAKLHHRYGSNLFGCSYLCKMHATMWTNPSAGWTVLALQHPQGYYFIFNLDMAKAERDNAYHELYLVKSYRMRRRWRMFKCRQHFLARRLWILLPRLSLYCTLLFTPPSAGSRCICVNRMSTGWNCWPCRGRKMHHLKVCFVDLKAHIYRILKLLTSMRREQ